MLQGLGIWQRAVPRHCRSSADPAAASLYSQEACLDILSRASLQMGTARMILTSEVGRSFASARITVKGGLKQFYYQAHKARVLALGPWNTAILTVPSITRTLSS